MNSHSVADVMSQMRSALTWAWTHQLEWSCSLSCRRQSIVAADSSTSSLGSEREWLPLTSTLTQTLNQGACAWVKSRMLACGWYGKWYRLAVWFSADLTSTSCSLCCILMCSWPTHLRHWPLVLLLVSHHMAEAPSKPKTQRSGWRHTDPVSNISLQKDVWTRQTMLQKYKGAQTVLFLNFHEAVFCSRYFVKHK